MPTAQRPTKEQVRQYMEQRKAERMPPPSPQEIRTRLERAGSVRNHHRSPTAITEESK